MPLQQLKNYTDAACRASRKQSFQSRQNFARTKILPRENRYFKGRNLTQANNVILPQIADKENEKKISCWECKSKMSGSLGNLVGI